MNAELSNEKFREIELKLKTMTEALHGMERVLHYIEDALHEIEGQSDKALDRGDVLAAGRRLERIQNVAWRALDQCKALKKDG